jgi:hypothetical protein
MSGPLQRVPKQPWRAEHLATRSPEARRRLKWMDYHHAHGGNARRTCRHLDISPPTFYRWWRRYQPPALTTWERRSRRPQRRRRPAWSPAVAAAVRARRPAGYAVGQPGDLVQGDTLDLRPLCSMAMWNAPSGPTPRSSTR